VNQPSYEMGVKSFNLLLEEINASKNNVPFTPKIIELETSLVIRDSTIKKGTFLILI
jgi:LacI family transcriptional regulator